MAVLGFASLPLSFLVGLVSPHISDRALTAAALLVTAVGAALTTRAGDPALGAVYFGGGGMLFMVRPSWYFVPVHAEGTGGSESEHKDCGKLQLTASLLKSCCLHLATI